MLDLKYDYHVGDITVVEFMKLIKLLEASGLAEKINPELDVEVFTEGYIYLEDNDLRVGDRFGTESRELRVLLSKKIYKYKDNLYIFNGEVKRKNPETREWETEYSYSPCSNTDIVYIRNKGEFLDRFEQII